MKRRVVAVLWFLAISMLTGPVQASEEARLFMDGTAAFRQGDWPAAIAAFDQLARQGIDNGQLYYNLGNAYLKNGDLGHALLWYERALKRIPNDPDLRFNYDYALTLTKDERVDQVSPLLRILFFWKYRLSPETVRWIALVLNAVLWTALTVLAVRRKRLLRPGTVMTAVATMIFTATAVFNYIEAVDVRSAVILPESVSVRSGFGETATELFVLHAGTRVRVERESATHYLVRYTDDKIGWVKKEDAGVI